MKNRGKIRNDFGKGDNTYKDKEKGFMQTIKNLTAYLNNHVNSLNQSKVFAGMMIVIINIASKFVTFNVSKTVESYLKYTFSRHIIVFAATWLGTRDIYISIFMTLLFIFVVDIIFNEKSRFCCLPESFINNQISKLEGMENQKPTPEEIVRAKIVLEKVKAKEDPNILFDSNQIPLDIPPIITDS
jgi:hypothetical protein